MLTWGAGLQLGILSLIGNMAAMFGLLQIWRCRAELTFWMDNEVSTFRKNLTRYVESGPFYQRRPQSRLIVIPSGMLHTMAQLPERRFSGGFALVFFGIALLILDFFI